MAIAVISFIVFIERSQRRIQIQYPKRQMGNRMLGGESSHLPLKINVPGVMNNSLGGYSLGDVNIVAAFDVDKEKVGKDLSEAIFSKARKFASLALNTPESISIAVKASASSIVIFPPPLRGTTGLDKVSIFSSTP